MSSSRLLFDVVDVALIVDFVNEFASAAAAAASDGAANATGLASALSRFLLCLLLSSRARRRWRRPPRPIAAGVVDVVEPTIAATRKQAGRIRGMII